MHSFKILNLKLKILLQSRSGQSLAEVMIGLAIGAILIGAASFAITTTLKTNLTTQRSQFAANAAQETIERVRAFASSDWQNIYGLTKGSSTQYYFVATGTQFFVNQGKEGVVENDIRSGLVGQWGFDEATGTVAYDMTGNRNNTNFSGSIVRATTTCKIGNCVGLDGASDSYISSSNNMSPTSSQTYSIWIKPNVLSGLVGIFTTHNYVLTSNIGINLTNDRLSISIGYTDGTREFSTKLSNFLLSTNSWTHVVLIYNATDNSVSFYVNGTYDSRWALAKTVKFTSEKVLFGQWSYVYLGNYRFNGSIDDARIYNRALSADEVKQLYNSATYTRYFYVENGCRTNDASSTYSGVSPCGGGSVDDPSSQKISSVVQWGTGGTGQIILADILTRWKNAIFQQSDWSGGVSENVLINSGTTFASSSNVNSGGGSLRINGL
ncbi:MAG: Uncharacterized protein LiPW41_246 [Parcubacteria group bacterium LiPW_41]|nr:MAG: Uncharacterized protein LiPW41_246 [Parcubacteria group bacterium LiPW_41]